MGNCATGPKRESGPSPVAPPADDSSTHDTAINTTTTEEKSDGVEAPLVDLSVSVSEAKPEETPAEEEVSTPTAVKESAPALSQAPVEEAPAAQPEKEQEEKEKPQQPEEPKAEETTATGEESKPTN